MADDSGDASGFGVVLRTYRVVKGLTQEQVAARSGLSIRAIGDIERGKVRRPHRDSVELLATALELTVAERDDLLRHRGVRPVEALSATASMAEAAPRPTPAQLPGDINDFTGRHADIEALRKLLAGPTVLAAPVVVAVVGAGGIGKPELGL